MSFTRSSRRSGLVWVALAVISIRAVVHCECTVAEDAVDRLQSLRLQAVRQARTDFASQRKSIPRSDGYQQHRANLHVHSHFSHDSRGQLADILAAAKQAGTSVLMFTEHPAEHYDFFKDGHRGLQDGVLLIPGAEQSGFLIYPTFSLQGITTKTPQELADLVRGRDGQIFVSHLEERMDWQIAGISGTEIYNTHADFKEEKNLVATLKNPFKLFQLSAMIQKYPQECIGGHPKLSGRLPAKIRSAVSNSPTHGSCSKRCPSKRWIWGSLDRRQPGATRRRPRRETAGH